VGIDPLYMSVIRGAGLYALPPDAPILNAMPHGAGVTREAWDRLTLESAFSITRVKYRSGAGEVSISAGHVPMPMSAG